MSSRADQEEAEREANRDAVLARKRQYETVGSGSEGEGSGAEDEGSGDGSSSGSESDESSTARKRRRKEEKKAKKKDKKSKKSKKSKKHKKDKKDKKSKRSKEEPSAAKSMFGVFGAYGICKSSDQPKHQRSFEAWMAEVKAVPSFTGAKWELAEYFKEFQEDFNTASFPNDKYYNYDKWEHEEYQRKRALEDSGLASKAQSDEAAHRREQIEAAEAKKAAELRRTMESLSGDKRAEMKAQEMLKAQMTAAFKIGDTEQVEKIKARLVPDKPQLQEKHPWA